jgi:hypothetical protein
MGSTGVLRADSAAWQTITSSVKDHGGVALFGCKVASGAGGDMYIRSLAVTSSTKGISVSGGTTNHTMHGHDCPGSQLTYQYLGWGEFARYELKY